MKRGAGSRVFMAPHYRAIGDIINQIADAAVREQIADHFATAFRKAHPNGFDPHAWQVQTGGRIRGFDIRKGTFEDGTK